MWTIIITLTLIILAFLLLRRAIKQGFGSPSKWESNNQEKAIDMLLEDISQAKERILFFGGKGDTYDDERVIQALDKKNIPIDMIFQTSEITSGPLGRMVSKKNNITLSFVGNLESKPRHFRVVDYDYVYIEKYHEPECRDRYFKRLPNTRFLPAKYSRQFEEIKTQAEKAGNK